MSYGSFMHGSIQITPAVPAHLLEGSPYATRDASYVAGTDLFISTEPAWDSSEPGTADSLIVLTSDEERGSRDTAAEDLKAIVELLGDGYTYDGYFTGSDGDSEDMFRLSIKDGKVVNLSGEVVYGLGPIGKVLSGVDIEAALGLLAGLCDDDPTLIRDGAETGLVERIREIWKRNTT